MHRATTNLYLRLSAKGNGTQRRTKEVHDVCIVRTAVCQKARLGMNNEKIKPLAVIDLKAGRQAISQYKIP